LFVFWFFSAGSRDLYFTARYGIAHQKEEAEEETEEEIQEEEEEEEEESACGNIKRESARACVCVCVYIQT